MCLYEQKRPALADISVGITGILACRDGMKNVPPPRKRTVKFIRKIYLNRDPVIRPVPAIVPFRL